MNNRPVEFALTDASQFVHKKYFQLWYSNNGIFKIRVAMLQR